VGTPPGHGGVGRGTPPPDFKEGSGGVPATEGGVGTLPPLRCTDVYVLRRGDVGNRAGRGGPDGEGVGGTPPFTLIVLDIARNLMPRGAYYLKSINRNLLAAGRR
jgi:hypothetical protein